MKEAPMLNRDEDILKAAEDWQNAGRGAEPQVSTTVASATP